MTLLLGLEPRATMRFDTNRNRWVAALVGVTLLSWPSASYADPCPIAGQNPMMIVQLFFGQDIAGKGHLPKRAWNAFLKDTVTPRFPGGFTVFDSYGQWRP